MVVATESIILDRHPSGGKSW